MAQSKKAPKGLASSPFSGKGLLIFIVLFALVGAVVLLKSNAARLSTETLSFNGVSNINALFGSSNYSVVNDQVGGASEQVALVSTGGMVSFGGKGGGTTGKPISSEMCYVMKISPGSTANVQLMGTNGGVVTRDLKAWPYSSGPAPYETECVTSGTLVQKSVPDFQVLSGGPVYFYGIENRVVYPY